MAANPLPLRINSRLQTPSLNFTISASTHFPLTNFACSTPAQKISNNRLFLSCRCGALAIDANRQSAAVEDAGVMLFPLFQEMGFNLKDTEAILGDNAGFRITPFESIRSRIQLFQSVGLNRVALAKLIAKRPDVLTAKEIDAELSFIFNDSDLELKGEIEPTQMFRFLCATEPRFMVGFERKVKLLHQYGITNENLVRVLNTVNLTKVFCLRSSEDMERMLAFLHRFGGVDLILRRPAILNYDFVRRMSLISICCYDS